MDSDDKNVEKKYEKNKDKKSSVHGGSDLNETNTKTIRNSLKKTKKGKENTKKCDNMDDDSWEKLSYFQKAKRMISFITVEPILACYVMPSVLSALATQNLYLEKACRVNLKFDHHVCDALTLRDTANFTAEEEAVQTLVASVTGWKTVLQSFLPCGILIFLGAYSDRVGQRKFCMLLPIIGEFLTSIGLIVNTYFFYELPIEVAAVTEAIFPALTGGWFTMFMGIFSYIGDITTEEQRTLRIGIVNLFYSLGVPVGAALSGILVRKIGLYGVFSISATLYILSFFYGFFRIKEIKKTDIEVKTNGCCEWLRDFFDTRYVKETLMVAFKPGPNNRRLRVIMLVVVMCVVIGPIYGEMSVMYLFTRYRFNWNEVDFSMFSTYAMCTSLVAKNLDIKNSNAFVTGLSFCLRWVTVVISCSSHLSSDTRSFATLNTTKELKRTLFSVGIFSHVLKFDDAIIGVISCMSKILSGFMYAFSTETWHIYIAPLIEIFNGTSFIAMRSMVSKLVEKDELGKVNSFFGLAEAMMPLVYAPMYTTVYTATLKTFPGAFFLLGGGLTVPAVLIFLWLYLANKKHNVEKARKNKENDKSAEKPEKNGIENKAFHFEEKEIKADKLESDVNQSQIEMGFTESMICTNKL